MGTCLAYDLLMETRGGKLEPYRREFDGSLPKRSYFSGSRTTS